MEDTFEDELHGSVRRSHRELPWVREVPGILRRIKEVFCPWQYGSTRPFQNPPDVHLLWGLWVEFQLGDAPVFARRFGKTATQFFTQVVLHLWRELLPKVKFLSQTPGGRNLWECFGEVRWGGAREFRKKPMVLLHAGKFVLQRDRRSGRRVLEQEQPRPSDEQHGQEGSTHGRLFGAESFRIVACQELGWLADCVSLNGASWLGGSNWLSGESCIRA